METSKNGIDLIKRFEGCKLTAYKCPAGVWTIGYGHTRGVHRGLTILPETAEHFLISDLKMFENHVNYYNEHFKYRFTQNQFDALVSFAFNVGSISQLTANGTRNKKTIAEKMLLYDKAGGQILEGLKKRRQAEHDLFTVDAPTEKRVDVDSIARDVIAGKWGNGATRKKKLTDAGYDYETIRKRVNEIKKGG